MLALLALGAASLGCTGAERATEALSRAPSPSSTSASTPTTSGEPAITIETPFADGEVGSPVSVTGTADVAGAQLRVRVLDAKGQELAAVDVEASCGNGCRGVFAAELFFFVERRQPGSIEVSGVATGGTPAVASVPVVIFPS